MLRTRVAALLATVLVAVSGTVFGTAGSAQAAPEAVWDIINGGNIKFGVIRYWSGSYTNYDDVLLPYEWTDKDLGWEEAGGIYLASGYCARRWTSTDWTNWSRAGSDWVGPAKFHTAGNYAVKISEYRC